MSHLKYSSYEGTGVYNVKAYHYNQAVRVPAGADRVELSGQGITTHYKHHTLSKHLN